MFLAVILVTRAQSVVTGCLCVGDDEPLHILVLSEIHNPTRVAFYRFDWSSLWREQDGY